MSRPRISVILPTLNPGPLLQDLLLALQQQRPHPPDELVVIDSGSRDGALDALVSTPIPVTRLEEAAFGHGRTRNRGVQAATGDWVVFLSQDAVPAHPGWLDRLCEPLRREPGTAAAYSRQIPRDGAPPEEQVFLRERFPAGVRTVFRLPCAEQSATLERVFFSNVSAVYRRDVLCTHPFDETLIMSEDQKSSRDLMLAGWATAYVPGSMVWHSHRYSLKGIFQRYFDSAHSLLQIFPRHGVQTSAAMGGSYLVRESRQVLGADWRRAPYYAAYTLAKISGSMLGHAADRLPRSLCRACSLHRYHWDRA